ncbi:hypothetical protein CPC08DRAFT_527182 [Agrocybe pediades]|nr:hypothetical protein CPC08DRAFT_527182 [Agrocybe pediades]
MAAIHKIHDDLLWHIFLLNANLNDIYTLKAVYQPGQESIRHRYSPLTITRRTSQVCTRWRHLILRSSSIWGRLIHLDCLDQVTDQWRMEVLMRSRDAPLEIKGDTIGYMMEDFFFFLLATEWERIRWLDVRMNNDFEFEDDAWGPLTRPAPALEYFNLQFYTVGGKPQHLGTNIFGGDAPSLRAFHSTSIDFRPFSPWVSQLRHLTLLAPASAIQMLASISQMTYLESLRIVGCEKTDSENRPNPPRRFSLPCLKDLVLEGSFKSVALVMDSIAAVSDQCGLSLKLAGLTNVNVPDSKEVTYYKHIFERYCRSYSQDAGPESFCLHMDSHHFLFYNNRSTPSELNYRVDVQASKHFHILPFMQLLSRTVMTYPVKGITHLDLSLPPHNRPFLKDVSLVLLDFVSLKTLLIKDMKTLTTVRNVQRENPLVFPSLSVIQVVAQDKLDAALIEDYLNLRKDMGAPIKCLDLTFTSLQNFGNLRTLENFAGLELLWCNEGKIDEVTQYTCGNPRSRILNF